MSRTVYALLVGIDDYPPPVPRLHGCVNDIRRVHDLLAQQVAQAGDRFAPQVLTDRQATRQALIDGFQTHLTQAQAGDVALFYYSGHGSQARTAPEFWPVEPDRLDETLVCVDSRRPGRWDLADKELSRLIAGVAANNPHVVIILDCCHSGTGTRMLEEDEHATVRRAPTDGRVRPLEDYLVTPREVAAFGHTPDTDTTDWLTLPHGPHILLAACRSDEEAKELDLGGEPRGAFSYFLLDALQRSGHGVSYRGLFDQVAAQVQAQVSLQTPQLEAVAGADLDQPFLGGAGSRRPVFTVSYRRGAGWVLDAGTAQGIQAMRDQETTCLALFAAGATSQARASLAGAIGEAQVTTVSAGDSRVRVALFDGTRPSRSTTYQAVVSAVPLPRLVVALEGSRRALTLLRAALRTAGPDGGPSRLVRTGSRAGADLRVIARANRYQLRRAGDAYPLAVDVTGFTAESAALVVQRLEHMARWLTITGLANAASQLPADAVRLEVVQRDAAGGEVTALPGTDLRLDYQLTGGQWRTPAVKLQITNTTTGQRIYCMPLILSEAYAAHSDVVAGAAPGFWLNPGETRWAAAGDWLPMTLPDELWQQGLTTFRYWIKLLVSSHAADATRLAHDALPVTFAPMSLAGARQLEASFDNTLDRLLARVSQRATPPSPAHDEALADWTTRMVALTVVHAPDRASIPRVGMAASLGAGVIIEGHPALQAQACLAAHAVASRDLGNLALPAVLRDDPDAVPFEFTRGHRGEPGLSVLELSEVADYTAVTPAAPLTITTPQVLAEGETVLPLAYDGEFFVPLGYMARNSEGTVIHLERLTPPTSAGARDVVGSIKIFFQKLANRHLGMDYPYPLVRTADVAGDGSVTYSPPGDMAAVRARVTAAQRILIYMHGFVGDTRGMTASSRTEWLQLPNPVPAVGERYDLILTVDYENINTRIDETARAIKQRLHDAGLPPQHGKTVHLVAHSMGGLVSRWLIEKEKGHEVIQHLVVLGTPSSGTPWVKIQDWATFAIGIGLNSLATVAWPVKVIGSLVGFFEKIDDPLDQMRPNSEFLRTLAESDDPHVPYSVIAGNTSLIPSVLAADPSDPQGRSRLERFLASLNVPRIVHALTSVGFLGAPNDIAVSVASIKAVPDNRQPAPVEVEVACDHVSYFSTEAGLRALAEALAA